MRVVLRADASPTIGSGHVMRTLCLADTLRQHGAQTLLLSRGLPPHLGSVASAAGHQVVDLPSLPAAAPACAETAWPEDLQLEDARQVEAALGSQGVDWLVVDHYGLAITWERALQSRAAAILAIDDLGRHHACTILLDQNASADAQRYAATRSSGAQCLLGPRYALLRPEFSALREQVAPRTGPVRRILVFLGGMDSGDATSKVLNALRRVRPRGCEVNVVIGPMHPARTAIESLAGRSSWLTCHVQTARMAELCAAADMAVGAGGGATWERCALGVPTVALVLAPNQRDVLLAAARQGLVYALADPVGTPRLARHLDAVISNEPLRQHISLAGMREVDGLGTQRVAGHMLAAQLTLRRADLQDGPLLRSWRNEPRVRAASRNTREIGEQEHQAWLRAALGSEDRKLLLGELEGCPIGSLRFDLAGDEAEVSIYLGPGPQSRGMGLALLKAGQVWLRAHHPKVAAVRAEVLGDNRPSHQLFTAAGYERSATTYLYRF